MRLTRAAQLLGTMRELAPTGRAAVIYYMMLKHRHCQIKTQTIESDDDATKE